MPPPIGGAPSGGMAPGVSRAMGPPTIGPPAVIPPGLGADEGTGEPVGIPADSRLWTIDGPNRPLARFS